MSISMEDYYSEELLAYLLCNESLDEDDSDDETFESRARRQMIGRTFDELNEFDEVPEYKLWRRNGIVSTHDADTGRYVASSDTRRQTLISYILGMAEQQYYPISYKVVQTAAHYFDMFYRNGVAADNTQIANAAIYLAQRHWRSAPYLPSLIHEENRLVVQEYARKMQQCVKKAPPAPAVYLDSMLKNNKETELYKMALSLTNMCICCAHEIAGYTNYEICAGSVYLCRAVLRMKRVAESDRIVSMAANIFLLFKRNMHTEDGYYCIVDGVYKSLKPQTKYLMNLKVDQNCSMVSFDRVYNKSLWV
ncbi:hypothetical protein [Epinotia aporema granulovirus]|uniref:Uncharacterized protein n=1 Tax=Epinotia aporema granulovirus TaxID=166056 RepID=K4EQ20_9BBAC|nr:hypothetical protein [Epinotia aporema granulovirus]AER41472.1 hypothetical protein [Epinotia aporema granulovirus]